MPIFVEGSEEENKMTTKQEFKGVAELLWKPHTTQVRVRYGETDAMGYVYYGNYALYFEVGRNETMRKLGFPYGRIEEYGIMMPVVDMHLHYDSAAHYDDLLDITTGVLELHAASMIFGYIVSRAADRARLVYGTTTLAFVDSTTRKPVRVPELVRERIGIPQ